MVLVVVGVQQGQEDLELLMEVGAEEALLMVHKELEPKVLL
jgi:hypothetical protein